MKKRQAELFPEILKEEAEDRSAILRKAAQVTRHHKRRAAEYLKGRDVEWLIDYLVDNGPSTEFQAMHAVIDRELEEVCAVLIDLWSLWRIGKLWRVSQGVHPGVGELSHLYGIKGLHKKPR